MHLGSLARQLANRVFLNNISKRVLEQHHFEGVSSTTVILAPGACRKEAPGSTRCVGNVAVCAVCGCVRLCFLSSARLDFVGRRNTLELFACKGVPRNRCCTVLSSLWRPKVTSLDRGTQRLTLGAFWVVPGRAFEWLWAQTRQNYIHKLPIYRPTAAATCN